MIMMLRILFGAETVSSKLTTACFHVDSWFTGADFPHAALACIRSAVRRRKLVFYFYFVLLNVCVRMWGSMFCCLFCDKWQNPIFFMGSTTTRYGKEPEFIPGGACDVSRASRRLLAWIQQHFKKAVGEAYSQNSSSESHGTVEVRATKLQRPLHFQGYHNICLRPVSSTCQDEMCISGASHFS